jgi:hypothetical protein
MGSASSSTANTGLADQQQQLQRCEAVMQEQEKEKEKEKRIWRQDKFLAEFGGVVNRSSSRIQESNLSSGLRYLSEVMGRRGDADILEASNFVNIDTPVSSSIAAALAWAADVEAALETASCEQKEEEKKKQAFKISEDIIKKVKGLWVQGNEGVRAVVIPCGWEPFKAGQPEKAVRVLYLPPSVFSLLWKLLMMHG